MVKRKTRKNKSKKKRHIITRKNKRKRRRKTKKRKAGTKGKAPPSVTKRVLDRIKKNLKQKHLPKNEEVL